MHKLFIFSQGKALSKVQTLNSSTFTTYKNPLCSPRSKNFWRTTVRPKNQYSSRNGYSGWLTPLKEKEEDSFINSVMLSKRALLCECSQDGLKFKIYKHPFFSPKKHTSGVCSICTWHLQVQSQHSRVIVTPQWQIVWFRLQF